MAAGCGEVDSAVSEYLSLPLWGGWIAEGETDEICLLEEKHEEVPEWKKSFAF